MIKFILLYLWNGIVGWIGIGGTLIVLCGVLAWFAPTPAIRRTLINAAIIIAIAISVYAKGYHDEYVHIKAQWKNAEETARKAGDNARADALKHAADGMHDPFDSDDN